MEANNSQTCKWTWIWEEWTQAWTWSNNSYNLRSHNSHNLRSHNSHLLSNQLMEGKPKLNQRLQQRPNQLTEEAKLNQQPKVERLSLPPATWRDLQTNNQCESLPCEISR